LREKCGDTHKVQGLLAAIHVRKNFFQFMAFQALGMLERAHDVLLERLFQLVFLRIGPPAAVLEEELVARDGVIYALPVFDFLPCAVGKRIVRRGMVADAVRPRQCSYVFREEEMDDCTDMS
jgi:hypothetical protein